MDNLGYDVWEVEDIPSNTSSTIWILGRNFTLTELETIRDVRNNFGDDLDFLCCHMPGHIIFFFRQLCPFCGAPIASHFHHSVFLSTLVTKVRVSELFTEACKDFYSEMILGFGCMLRCGQMLLAEALKRIHLGRGFIWTRDTINETYLNLVNRFEDSKAAPFGIHQIATMGQDSGRPVGEWYSPNVIAQVLK